jgi:hypothetical protein
MNDEVERMRNEVVLTYLEVFFRHLPGGNDGNHETLQTWERVLQPGYEPSTSETGAGSSALSH